VEVRDSHAATRIGWFRYWLRVRRGSKSWKQRCCSGGQDAGWSPGDDTVDDEGQDGAAAEVNATSQPPVASA